jgi:predicted Zn-dependent protease
LVGCSTVPITGRKQLILTSEAEEAQLGLTAFDQIKKETPVSKDPAGNELIQKVGKRIAAVADLPNAQWEFVLFDSKQANAFCLPGGKVGVYTGILPITKDEAGLATVLGHEIGHAVARHGGERMSVGTLQQAGAQVAAAAGSYFKVDPQWQSAIGVAYGFGSEVGGVLPHSRLQESEADHMGLIFMARAGYDPEQAVAFWQRFSQYNSAGGDSTPAIFRTHPVDAKRIEQLKGWMAEAKSNMRPAK